MKLYWFFVVSVLSAVVLAQTGCALFVVGAAAGAGAGTYAYVEGVLKTTQPESLDKTWAATQLAVKDLGFPVVKSEKDALSAHLVAKTAQDKTVDISLKLLAEETTEIKIRIGVFGDQSVSDMILQKIRSRL